MGTIVLSLLCNKAVWQSNIIALIPNIRKEFKIAKSDGLNAPTEVLDGTIN